MLLLATPALGDTMRPSTAPATLSATRAVPVDEKLASLRRSVESLDEIDQILQRYQRYLDSSPSAASAELARQDMQTWQRRRDAGMVRFAGEWMDPAQRDGQINQAIAKALEGRSLMQQGRNVQGADLIEQALRLDPSNPTALYLRGVELYTRDDLPAARKCFEAVLMNLPRHGPSSANLAIILWRMDAILPAVNCHDQAMVAAPLERDILDNVAEAVETLPKRHRSEPAYQRMHERFLAQDRELGEILAEKGLYRWGATWVDSEQMELLKSAEAEIQEKLDELEEDFDRAQDRIDRIDEDIDANEREMRRLVATSYFRDRDGRLVRRSLPRIYYDIKEDNERLNLEREELQDKLDEFRALADEVQSRLPVPRYAGVQRLLGAEHAPLPADDPTSMPVGQPATQP